MLSIEVRYLSVGWRDQSTIENVELSDDALLLEDTSEGWMVTTTTFPRAHQYVGFYISESSPDSAPYFELANGEREALLPIKVPGKDEIWWIQANKWDECNKRYLSDLYRTAGRLNIAYKDIRLTVINNTFNFSVEELEYYLSDFKNGLWLLILDSQSAARINVDKQCPDFFNEEALARFQNFISSVEKIQKKPHISLRETQSKKPIKAVKPVPRTFREFAIKPSSKTLTSRDYIESLDTAENRYIHYCLDRAYYLLKSIERTALALRSSYEQRIVQERTWLEKQRSLTENKVDQSVYDNEIGKLQTDLAALGYQVKRLVGSASVPLSCSSGIEYGEYSLKLESNYGKSNDSFFVSKLNGEDFRTMYGSYLVAKFHCNLDNCDFLRYSEIRISGRFKRTREFNSKGAEYFLIAFHQVIDIEFITHPMKDELCRLQERKVQLAANDWVTPLSQDDIRERNRSVKVSIKKLERYEKHIEGLSDISNTLPRLSTRFKNVLKYFRLHKVKKASSSSCSMIFVQNPAYSSAKRYFKSIVALSGMDESVLDDLALIDNIGLVNVANLYEKWCLVQIVHVLTHHFGYQLDDGWQPMLVKAALNNDVNIEIKLVSIVRQQAIILTYEKELPSGKRPDFVIDLVTKKYIQDPNSNTWVINGDQSHRLVMDAKFRGAMTENYLGKLVDSLYSGKNYSENEVNKVFILQPTSKVIKECTSPLGWGKHCDYGQTQGHKFGSIFLSPSLKSGNSIQNLQRVLGLFFQNNSAILQLGNVTAWHNMSCISCGEHDSLKLQVVRRPTKAGNDRWLIDCKACGLLTVKTICSSCHQPLFKNGPNWTYHRTRAEQISNVVCPECETFL